LTCLRVCQMVSNSFLDIHLIRFNEIKGYISRLALKIVVMTREQGTEKGFWATLLFVTYVGFFPFTYLIPGIAIYS
ncbi:MAG: DUF6888 family protein, partial [Dolichospermum sp.]